MNFSRIFTKSHISTLSLASLMFLACTSIHAMEAGEEETQDPELKAALEILTDRRLHPELIPYILQFIPHDETFHAFILEALYPNPKFGSKKQEPRTTFEKTLTSLSLGSQLFKAIKGLNAREVERLIANGADIDVQDKEGLTPLMLLITQGDIAINNMLVPVISKGPRLDIQNNAHKTVAEIAHRLQPGSAWDQLFDGLNKLQALIKKGKSPETITEIKQVSTDMVNKKLLPPHSNAAMVLMFGGQFQLVEVLIDWEWDMHVDKQCLLTPLSVATQLQNERLITKLIKAGENPGSETDLLTSPITEKNPKIVALLLKHGANADGNPSALRQAIESSSLEIVKLLVDAQFPVTQELIERARQWAHKPNEEKLDAITEYLEGRLEK